MEFSRTAGTQQPPAAAPATGPPQIEDWTWEQVKEFVNRSHSGTSEQRRAARERAEQLTATYTGSDRRVPPDDDPLGEVVKAWAYDAYLFCVGEGLQLRDTIIVDTCKRLHRSRLRYYALMEERRAARDAAARERREAAEAMRCGGSGWRSVDGAMVPCAGCLDCQGF